MNTNKQAFTLVELIVVITILTILGTIGFFALQGYSADARNSKRISDLNNISNVILIRSSEGGAPLTFVGGNNENKINVNHIDVGGKIGVDDIYKAGILKYQILKVKRKDFIDPNEIDDYRIGATSTYGGRYDIATTLEKGGLKRAFIKGNFSAREVEECNVETVDGKVVTLALDATNKFKKGDRITTNFGTNLDIKSVGANKITFTFNTSMVGVTSIKLALPETKGLLSSKDDNSAIILHGSEENLPY